MGINLQVIQGTKKPKPDYSKIYQRIFVEKLTECINTSNCSTDLYKQYVYYGIKHINHVNEKRTINDIEHYLNVIQSIKEIIATFTPRELIGIFPIDKQYDGKKYKIKDYFYSIKVINDIGIDSQINDNIDNLLGDYHNSHIRNFCVNELVLVSSLRKLEGKKGIIEEFAEMQGKHLTTFSQDIDIRGNKVFVNNDTGEITPIKKKLPKYLRVCN